MEEARRAEDGIRDRNVTGVQTCALPISDAQKLLNYGFSKCQKYEDADYSKLQEKIPVEKGEKKEAVGIQKEGFSYVDTEGNDLSQVKKEKIGRASCRERV